MDPATTDENGFAVVSLEKWHEKMVEVLPLNSSGEESCWRWGSEKVAEALSNGGRIVVAKRRRDGVWNIYQKARKTTKKAKTIWSDKPVISEQGTVEVGHLGFKEFGFPKPLGLLYAALAIGSDGDDLVLDFFAGSGTTGHAVINLNREDDGSRKYILVEMGDYFDTVLKPRIEKVVYSPDWKDGKPTTPNGGSSHLFKYIRLESYEDTLNNLEFGEDPLQSATSAVSTALRDEFTMRYMLDVRTRGSSSLLNIDAFKDPTEYKLKIKKPGSDEYKWRNVDLIETFNYLIGLRLNHIDVPRQFAASFKHVEDPDLPEDAETRLDLDGKLKETDQGTWWFRKLEGWIPEDADNPDTGNKLRVLVIWRKLTDDIVKDNAVLDEWLRTQRIEPRSSLEYDLIYVNGTNNLPNVKLDDEHWRVRLIEEEFSRRMWDIED